MLLRVRVEEVRVDQPFERLLRHAAGGQGAVGVGFAVEVEAVGAVEIADGRCGLDQQ